MTLAPETRVLLTDALRPPAGYRVDVAVGTTYSLDLIALLLAPLAFAVSEKLDGGDLDEVDPLRLLEAARRHAEHTTVFCQVGGIHVPPNYRQLLTLVEDSVVEVMAPTPGAIFHPKIWALRFVDEAGNYIHRGVVLSRNMTLDRSWDTALILDEDADGTIAAAPMADFVEGLPGLAINGVDERRAEEIESLVEGLRGVSFAAPAPFTGGELLPIGLTDKRVWPFPASANRLLAISPFLTVGALQSLGNVTTKRTLVSRAESLDSVGSQALEGWNSHVLQRLAEVPAGEEVGAAEVVTAERQGTSEGLHAKTFVLDLAGSRSMVVTGSANLTSPKWGNNVEFDAMLEGPTNSCGVDHVLNGSPGAPGLLQLMEEYSVENVETVNDPTIATSREIETLHCDLALAHPVLEVTTIDTEKVKASLTFSNSPSAVGETRFWPISLPEQGQKMRAGATHRWTLAPEHVTPFVAVETTAGVGEARVTVKGVLKADLTGDVESRKQDALMSILDSKAAVLRYIVFLLGDPAYDTLFDEMAGLEGPGAWNASSRGAPSEPALLEPLVRASGRDEFALARVAALIEDLRSMDGGVGRVPDGLDALWDVVWQAHQERTS